MTFSEAEAISRLQKLDNTQVSIEENSKWFLSMKDSAKDIVKLWFKEFRKAPPKKKIAFLHLVNDIVQNGIFLVSHFGKLFEPVLPTAFKETAKVKKHSVRTSVAHLLIVWATRKVYSKNFLRQLRFICQRAVAEADASDASEEVKRNIIATSPFSFSFGAVMAGTVGSGGVAASDNSSTSATMPNPVAGSGSRRSKKRHRTGNQFSFDPNSNTLTSRLKPSATIDSGLTAKSISTFREELARELQTESIPPPEISDLVQTIELLQQSAASGDASTRRAIAQFPPEVSDATKAVEIITHATEQERHGLVDRIVECASELEKYNHLLEEEATQRHQLSLKLRAFQSQLTSRLENGKTEIEGLSTQLAHGMTLKQQLIKHMASLPDLNLLPDMTAGLDPLPTVGDLFG